MKKNKNHKSSKAIKSLLMKILMMTEKIVNNIKFSIKIFEEILII